MNRILYRIANNLNIYIDKHEINNELLKQLDEIKDQLLPYIQDIIHKHLYQAIINNEEYFKTIIIKNKFFKIEQLNRWIKQNKVKIITRMLPLAFIHTNDYSLIYTKFNINIKNNDTIFHWIVNNIDENWYIDIIIQELTNRKEDLLIKFFGPVEDFNKFKDQVGSEVYSTEKHENIINNNKTIVIFNNKIVDIDTYRKSTSKFKRVAFGSIVNNVLIIYYTTYNINVLKQFLKKHSNYTKIYLLQRINSITIKSDNTMDKYIRLAKKIISK